MSERWLVHFFRRHAAEDPERRVPALDYLESLPIKVAAEIHAVLDAVAAAPPPAFSGGGKWEAMRGGMGGIYEIRVQGGGMNHRMFCLLDRPAIDLGGPSIVCLGGLSKNPRTAADRRDYERIRQYRQEFYRRRTVWE